MKQLHVNAHRAKNHPCQVNHPTPSGSSCETYSCSKVEVKDQSILWEVFVSKIASIIDTIGVLVPSSLQSLV